MHGFLEEVRPDFEIMEWNESNCDIHTNRYVEEAYEKRQYAFVSDYFRLKALYDHGGVYMDTDMELHQPLESFLYTKAFFAFETPLFIHAGILGAEKNCGLIGELRRSYEEDTFDLTECPGEDFTIPRRLTQLLHQTDEPAIERKITAFGRQHPCIQRQSYDCEYARREMCLRAPLRWQLAKKG